MSTSGTPSGATGFFTDWTTEVATEPTHRDVDKPPSRFSAVLERSAGIRRGALALGTVAASAVAVAFIAPNPAANADPSASTWQRLRMCESSNNYKINTGNGYYGAYQFDLSTWRSVGGSGYPNLASPAEQDARALMLYRLRGWQPWTCASILGLREDSDARSGRINDISIGSAGSGGGSTAGSAAGSGSTSVPAFPGTRWYHFGDDNATIKRFQDQMHHRGFFPPGTGQYGPLTLAMVEQLQRLNGLIPNGYLGPNTWRMAWVGKYSAPSGGSTSAPAPAPAPSPVTASHGASAPAFPGSRWYHFGDNNATIKRFQDQMHRRGFFPPGTGQYGPLTLAMVEQLQRLNGLIPNGELGPNTWRMAWIGKYSAPTGASSADTAHRARTVPAFPGSRWYHFGDNNATIKRFQDQMHRRGFFPPGTGQYGPLTLAMVEQLQRLNGLIPNGELGPNTWRMAWVGKYHR